MRTMKNEEPTGEAKSIDEAIQIALEIVAKKNKKERNKVYVWRQRIREGKLSRELQNEILAEAGFTCVVEEKWAMRIRLDEE